MTTRLTLTTLLAIATFAPAALAIPAPMTPEQIEAASDLIIEGEVMDVTCVGEAEVTDASITQGYASTVAITATLKGSADETVDILFDAVEWLTAPALCSTVDLTHLRGEKGTYSLVGTEVEGYRLTAAGGFVEAPDSTPDDDLPVCALVDDPDAGPADDGGATGDEGQEAGPTPVPDAEDAGWGPEDVLDEDVFDPWCCDIFWDPNEEQGPDDDDPAPGAPAADDDDGCMAGPAASPFLALGVLAWIGRRRRRS